MEQYRNSIKNVLGVDDFVVDMIFGEAKRLKTLSLQAKHPFIFLGLLALLSNCLFPIFGLKRKINKNVNDFIFVSCPDTAFRTQNIGLLASGLSYLIIYLPNYHVLTALKYHRYFKEKGIFVFFPTIHLDQVVAAKRKLKSIIKDNRKLEDDFEGKKMISVLSCFITYDAVVKEYMDCVKSFKGKWILEHQKFYFLASVANLHIKCIPSTMLQHGIFFQPVYDFLPLLCDKVLCCSERERKIYIDNDTEADRIIVFGAPLQTLQQVEDVKGRHVSYDLLVMMTLINNDNVELVRQVLEYIKSNFNNILIRMRPRSRKNDELLLADTLKGLTLSKAGTGIVEDIMNCKRIVSFSLDANIEIVRCQKPFIYIWDGKSEDNITQLNCATKCNYKEEIRKLMNSDFYSSFSEGQYKEILGNTNIEELRNKFVSYVKFDQA